jgi:hypothetical protein
MAMESMEVGGKSLHTRVCVGRGGTSRGIRGGREDV